MKFNTTYNNSFSFTPDQEESIASAEYIEIYSKQTGLLLQVIEPEAILRDAHHVYVKDKFGVAKRSYYKVYSF